MAISTRQSSMLAAEDWQKVYQTFKEADFQSYDFETLRKSMIDYLRLYYPEDFNDFIESSEYIALIDLIAFLGQSLAFRGDLNARENFIDTAARRDSVLKLARLVSYVPKRNVAASGLLKVVSVTTTESIFDSDGVSLMGMPIVWNDAANSNWLEQFVTVLNSSLVVSQRIGKPGNSASINGIKTDEYQINTVNNTIPVFPLTSAVEGVSLPFEVVSCSSTNSVNLFETSPSVKSKFNLVMRNDRLGNNSVNTGYFVYFKQGILQSQVVTLVEGIPNRVINVNVSNINNTDIWLFKLNAAGDISEEWSQVPAITGNNIAYSNLSNINRKIFQVVSRADDQIDLVFGDGVFAEIPQGNYKIFYRTSIGTNYKISPSEIQNKSVNIKYVSKTGRVETLTLTCSLQSTVVNASARETSEEIRQRAPQQYYTQNRIVTGEDYNIFPFTAFSNIVKAKAVNRTSSGISRYLDVVDSAGKYSSTNIFGSDGWLYSDETLGNFAFEFTTNNDILRILRENINNILRRKEMKNFYYEKFNTYFPLDLFWHTSTVLTNQTSGYFTDQAQRPLQIGSYANDDKQYIRPGCLLKFKAPTGQYFDAGGYLRTGKPTRSKDRLEIYASVRTVVEDGSNQGTGALDDGTGPVILNEIIPTGAILSEIIPTFVTVLNSVTEQSLIANISLYRNFGLRYDIQTGEFKLIKVEDLDTTGPFSLDYAGDTSGSAKDASWLIRFDTNGILYNVIYRQLNFVFESKMETRFYFDPTLRIFDPKTAQVITDYIKVLGVNTAPDSSAAIGRDYDLQVHGTFLESDGFTDNTRIKVTYTDSDQDSVPDQIDFFRKIVNPTVNPQYKYVFFKLTRDSYGHSRYSPVDTESVCSDYPTAAAIQLVVNTFNPGQLFFATYEKKFYAMQVTGSTRALVQLDNLIYRIGRGNLRFQYRHNSPGNRRIDPSPNNLIDLYVLTKNFNAEYRAWLLDNTGKIKAPVPPTSEELRLEFGSLDNYKPVSDTLLYSAASFKPLFGPRAIPELRATFKVIKNPSVNVSDSEIKSKMIESINNYFEIGNWEFGDTFYFSELSSYLHQVMAPNVASIILVPQNESMQFGSLYQVNSEPHEIVISAATVDNIEIISAVTASQLNQN
ncbi:hypothetical protein UFOVP116_406 [uncultured Caudovirales phage]|uniref:Baseplate wedge subunit n=1 Tax=uncultured Caudovirales phage TaxID=2100421 RepID=A0A6J5LAS5_9CAUD|nr:hypothetical protein UFOVP116_406 [uncultured Caudovirales phage]